MSALRAADARDHALFVVLPVLVTIWLLHTVLAGGILAVDFAREYWVAGSRLLDGGDVYRWSAQQIASGVSFPYPPLTAVACVPFALLAHGLGDALFTALCMLAALGSLRVLEVRDWRLYGLVTLWSPVVAGWQTANLTLILVLGIALIWRHRDRPVLAGVLSALIISLKPFVWPIGLWLLCTRRYRAAGWALASGLLLNAAAWALVGGDALERYLRLSSTVTRALARDGYGAVAFATQLGGASGAGIVLGVILSMLLATACLLAARRGREQEALTAAVGLMLTASPLVWNHYLALLIVPLALARPRLSPAWVVPLVLWACPSDHPAAWQVLLLWAVAGMLLVVLMRRPAPPRAAPATDRASRLRARIGLVAGGA